MAAGADDTTAFSDLAKRPPREGVDESLGGYELLGEIGRGGMGTVHRARLTGTTLVVALKQIRPHEQGESAAWQFRNEIENAAGLRHPNIVPVYHVGEHNGWPFYTMALVAGGSLCRHFDRLTNDAEAAARLMAKTARAVHHAHQRRILHRDLKPANILIDEDGEPHVSDFGLAARIDEFGAVTESAPTSGSLPWMAPEAVRGDGTLTTAVDVWALGVVLYELLTGQRPFVGSTWREMCAAILEHDPPAPRALNQRVPRDLDAICLRCLAKDPDRRYESATAVALDLERWLRDEPVRARPAGPGERFARSCRRNPRVAGGIALAAIVLVALLAAAVSIAREMSHRLAQAVCQNNEYSARQLAVIVHGRFERIGDAVLNAANDPALHDACRNDNREAAELVLNQGLQRAAAGRLRNVFVLDPDGVLRATTGASDVVGKGFPGRDYFQGAINRADKQGLDRVHVSRVFRSEDDDLDKLAVSSAFALEPGGRPWVIVGTVTTDATFGQNDLPTDELKAVLIAPLDTTPPRAGDSGQRSGYVIMAHPALKQTEPSVRFPPGRPVPVGSATKRSSEFAAPVSDAPFPQDENYEDPVGVDRPAYGGRWLAGSARVGNTELVVLVQQPYGQAVAPYQRGFGYFLIWVCGLAGAGLLLFASLWLVRSRGMKAGRRPE